MAPKLFSIPGQYSLYYSKQLYTIKIYHVPFHARCCSTKKEMNSAVFIHKNHSPLLATNPFNYDDLKENLYNQTNAFKF